jgi:hypothetical protein
MRWEIQWGMQLYMESAMCTSVTAAIAIGMECVVLGLLERTGYSCLPDPDGSRQLLLTRIFT